MIPICIYEMSKQKCFTNMMNKACKVVNDIACKCSSQSNSNQSKSDEAL